MNSSQPYTCLQYPKLPYPFLWICSMDYGPHPVENKRKPCQTCSPLPCMAIPMIWNTVACNTSCNERTTAISILTLPPVTLPILVQGYHWLWSPPLWVCMQAMWEVFAFALHGHTNNMKYRCMQYSIDELTTAISIILLPQWLVTRSILVGL